MLQYIRKWGVLTLSCLFALLLATACFQSAGDSLQATSVAQGFATFTPIPLPTEEPSNTPEEIAAPEETETPVDIQIVVTATPDPFATQEAIEEETQQAASVPQQIEPPEMTATALIERATQQAALEMTMTAGAVFTPIIPTLPPTVVFPTATFPSDGGGAIDPILPGGSCVHVVSAGENLFRISLRYGVTLSAILAVNPQITNPNLIFINQQIVIPI
jgi:hypothetical protein